MTQDVTVSKELVGGVFSRASETYGREGPPFDHFGARLVEVAQLQPGQTVLDIATGRGAVLFPAAVRVGAAGRVVGIDLAEGMVTETSAAIKARGLANATVQQMDAERLLLSDASFDAVLCGFGLMFLPNLAAAIQELRGVLRPGGTIGVTTWGDRDGRWAWSQELSRKYAGQTTVSMRHLMAQGLEHQAEVAAVLDKAGFVDVKTMSEQKDATYADEEVWWGSVWSHGQRGPLEAMEPAALAAYKAEAFTAMSPQRQPDGFHQVWTANIGTARKPA